MQIACKTPIRQWQLYHLVLLGNDFVTLNVASERNGHRNRQTLDDANSNIPKSLLSFVVTDLRSKRKPALMYYSNTFLFTGLCFFTMPSV